MGEIQKSHLEELAEQINSEHGKFRRAFMATYQHALRVGDLLNEAKAEAGHGNWAEWVENNCEFSDRTARVYMRIANHRAEVEQMLKTAGSADLSIQGVLGAIAAPKEEPEDRFADVQRIVFERLEEGDVEFHDLHDHVRARYPGDPEVTGLVNRTLNVGKEEGTIQALPGEKGGLSLFHLVDDDPVRHPQPTTAVAAAEAAQIQRAVREPGRSPGTRPRHSARPRGEVGDHFDQIGHARTQDLIESTPPEESLAAAENRLRKNGVSPANRLSGGLVAVAFYIQQRVLASEEFDLDEAAEGLGPNERTNLLEQLEKAVQQLGRWERALRRAAEKEEQVSPNVDG